MVSKNFRQDLQDFSGLSLKILENPVNPVKNFFGSGSLPHIYFCRRSRQSARTVEKKMRAMRKAIKAPAGVPSMARTTVANRVRKRSSAMRRRPVREIAFLALDLSIKGAIFYNTSSNYRCNCFVYGVSNT